MVAGIQMRQAETHGRYRVGPKALDQGTRRRTKTVQWIERRARIFVTTTRHIRKRFQGSLQGIAVSDELFNVDSPPVISPIPRTVRSIANQSKGLFSVM
jgi:hypothetical protein